MSDTARMWVVSGEEGILGQLAESVASLCAGTGAGSGGRLPVCVDGQRLALVEWAARDERAAAGHEHVCHSRKHACDMY